MRYFALLLSLGLTASTAFSQPAVSRPISRPEEKPKPRTGTPEEQIKNDMTAFVSLLNTGNNFYEMQNYVYGSRFGFFGANEWFTNWERIRKYRQIVFGEVKVDNVVGDSATATIRYEFQWNKDAGRPQGSLKETLTLKFAEKNWAGVKSNTWQIVPTKKEWLKADYYQPFLVPVATELAQQDWNYSADFQATRSVLQLKELALGAQQVAQDYDEIFVFAPEYAKEALSPYLASTDIFIIPDTDESYTFNGYLSGKSTQNIKQPEKTVMFYEGKNEKPVFRYNGKAAIAYVDGQAQLVTPEEVAELIWKV